MRAALFNSVELIHTTEGRQMKKDKREAHCKHVTQSSGIEKARGGDTDCKLSGRARGHLPD